MVLATIKTSQFFDKVVNAHIMQVVQISSLRARRRLRPWHVRGRFAGYVAAVCFLRRRRQWQYLAGFTGDEARYAVFSIPVVRPKMRDIIAGLDETDSQAVHPCRGADAASIGLLL